MAGRFLSHVMFVLLVCVVFSGCGPSYRRNGVPATQASLAVIRGYPETIRTWGDDVSPEFQASCFTLAVEQRRAYVAHYPESATASIDLLCISGGGENGAFGAGLLNGWTTHRNRPEFMLVTGISTGALTAPMAFIGPPYDDRLKRAYTQVTNKDVLSLRPLIDWLSADSVADNRALRKLVEKYVDQEMVERVAVEHAKGRRLLVATTNLDAQRPVIWDMGAIASSGNRNRVRLFRDVLMASASIPGVFSPTYVDVSVGEKRFEEMHVDGGTAMQVFLFGSGVNISILRDDRSETKKEVRCFVLRNAKLGPEPQEVTASVRAIASRAIETLLKFNGRGDVLRIYSYCRELKIQYYLVGVPESFDYPVKEPFDRDYMNALYDEGYKAGAKGCNWLTTPTGLLPSRDPESPISQ